MVIKSFESLESQPEASDCKERLEASSLCRCAQRLLPIRLPESVGTFSDTDGWEDSVKLREEAEGWKDLLRAIVGHTDE